MLILLKIIVWFVAVRYFIALLKELNRLAKCSPLCRGLFLASLIVFLVFHPDFFHAIFFNHHLISVGTLFSAIIKSSNYQIIKSTTWFLLLRLPVVVLLWLLSDTRNKTKNNNNITGGYLGRQRKMNKPVVNGIASLKLNKTFIWALLLVLFGGNWLSHHILFSVIIFSSFFLCKIAMQFLKNIKAA